MVARQWGRIINISSVEGKVASLPAISPYVTAKHALHGLTKSVAVEYGELGITCNAICPGAVETDTFIRNGENLAASDRRNLRRRRPGLREALRDEAAVERRTDRRRGRPHGERCRSQHHRCGVERRRRKCDVVTPEHSEPERGAVIEYDPIAMRPAGTFYAEGDDLRERHPYFWNSVAQGFWVLTRCEAIREAYQTPDIFTSESFMPTDPNPTYHMIPTQERAPRHVKFRQILNPSFSPAAVAQMEPIVRRHCVDTIASFLDRGHCDVVADFGGAFPTKVFLDWAGLPPEDSPMFVAWVATVFQGLGDSSATAIQEAMTGIQDYFRAAIADRRIHPRDPDRDVVTNLVQSTLDG